MVLLFYRKIGDRKSGTSDGAEEVDEAEVGATMRRELERRQSGGGRREEGGHKPRARARARARAVWELRQGEREIKNESGVRAAMGRRRQVVEMGKRDGLNDSFHVQKFP